jgi:hypothetical protein
MNDEGDGVLLMIQANCFGGFFASIFNDWREIFATLCKCNCNRGSTRIERERERQVVSGLKVEG